MKRPAISIIVPVYNAEKYLRECLDSIRNQTFSDFEVVCVNDGSTDGSLEIIKGFIKDDSRFRVVTQRNKGLGGARDTGVQKATGKFIGFVDADDTIESDMCETLYNLAIKNNAEIAFCNLSLFPVDDGKKKIWFNPYNGRVDGEFLYRNTQPTNKIFSHDLFDRFGVKFKKNDGACILLMVKAKGLASTNEKLYNYRIGHSSMSSNYKIESFIDTLDMVLESREVIRNDKQLESSLGDYFDFRIITALLQLLYVCVLKGDKDTYMEKRKELKQYNYKRNQYCKKLLSEDYGRMKYFAMMNVLPNNYYLSRIFIKERSR